MVEHKQLDLKTYSYNIVQVRVLSLDKYLCVLHIQSIYGWYICLLRVVYMYLCLLFKEGGTHSKAYPKPLKLTLLTHWCPSHALALICQIVILLTIMDFPRSTCSWIMLRITVLSQMYHLWWDDLIKRQYIQEKYSKGSSKHELAYNTSINVSIIKQYFGRYFI